MVAAHRRFFCLTCSLALLVLPVSGSVGGQTYSEALALHFAGDHASALRALLSLAGEGHPEAQIFLGLIYALGQGVFQDYAEAAKWYRLAAEQGPAEGQYNLGKAYYYGRGLPQDFVRAHAWFNLAASRMEEGEGRRQAAENRDQVATMLTPEQIAEAQRLAREWWENFDRGEK